MSTALERWSKAVEPELLTKVEATLPVGRSLEGKHPSVGALAQVPAACIECHSRTVAASPFAAMIHLIHLSDGEENHFMTVFGGRCTHCHKIDLETGRWSVPSGAEQRHPSPPPSGEQARGRS